VSCDLLREGAPIEPVPPVTHWKPDAVVSEALAWLTAAKIKLKKLANPSVHCHSNVS